MYHIIPIRIYFEPYWNPVPQSGDKFNTRIPEDCAAFMQVWIYILYALKMYLHISKVLEDEKMLLKMLNIKKIYKCYKQVILHSFSYFHIF